MRVFRDKENLGALDLEATEMCVRQTVHCLGATLLQKLVNSDRGDYRGPQIDDGVGAIADFVEYRTKDVTTVLGNITVNRAYYYNATNGNGMIPKDKSLDIEGTGFSPGVRRMMARVGANESFAAGRDDLQELAGITVSAKDIERVAEGIGEHIELIAENNRRNALSESVVPLAPKIQKLYIEMDGTGVPATKRETEGRKGKAEGGIAKTREAKLGVIFTQTGLDKDGKPIRDENSTTYTGGIETCEEFENRIYAEALRRGLSWAEQVIVLSDGAVWIREIVEKYFPNAITILDFYHASEYLGELAKTVYNKNTAIRYLWLDTQCKELREGDVGVVIEAMHRLKPKTSEAKEVLRKTIKYFENNRLRMKYAEYIKQGLFIGSGVIEAGCKTIVGQRLKQSGMRWTVKGANAIISLRCCQMSNQWENYWESRKAA